MHRDSSIRSNSLRISADSSLPECLRRCFFVALLLSCAARAEVLTAFDWAAGPARLPGRWDFQEVAAPDRMRQEVMRTSGDGGATQTCIRVEVAPGDKPGGWSGERAEVSTMLDGSGRPLPVNAASGHEYYGVSVKLANEWRAPGRDREGNAWGAFLQLHGPNDLDAPPSLALMAEKDFHLNICAGDLLDGGKRKAIRGSESLRFLDGRLRPGQWVEFLLEVVWAANESGSVTVFRRQRGENEWNRVLHHPGAPTLQYAHGRPPGDHYWKAGYYRSESAHRNVLWLGPIARGANRDEVAVAAFGRR